MRLNGSGPLNRFPLTLLLVLATVVWGWTFSLVKDAISAYAVVGFLAIRFVIGSAALGIVAGRRLTARTLGVGMGIGVVLAAAYLLQTFGLRYTTATNCGLITGLFAVFGVLANRILFGVRIVPVFWTAAGLSLVGLSLLAGAGPSPPTLGDLLTVGAAAGFGLQIALLDRFAPHHDPLALTFAQIAAATLVLLLIWPLSETAVWPSGNVWLALAVTGILATAVNFSIQVLAQQQLPAVRAAIILTLEPVFATFFGYLLAGDRLTGLQFTGAVLMFAAVGVIEIFSAERKTALVQASAAPAALEETQPKSG